MRDHWRRMGAAYSVLLISLLPTLIAHRRVTRYAIEHDRERLSQFVQLSLTAINRQAERHLDTFRNLADLPAVTDFDERPWRRFFEDRTFFAEHPAFENLICFRAVEGDAKEATLRFRPEPGGPEIGLLRVAEAQREPGPVKSSPTEAFSGLIAKAFQSTQPVAVSAIGNNTATIDVAVSIPPKAPAPAGILLARLHAPPLAHSAHRTASVPLTLRVTPPPDDPAQEPSIEHAFTLPLSVVGARLGLEYTVTPAFFEGSPRHLPGYVIFGGMVVGSLLFGIALLQTQARLRAERLAKDLRSMQERDRMLERATNDAIWDWDIESQRISWNEAVQAMFRYSAEQVQNQSDWWLERLHPDDRRRVWNGREMAVQTGGEFWADEYRFRRGDGTYASVIDRGYIIHDRQGLAIRMIGSMVDVTTQKEAEEARQKSERKLALHIQQTPLAVIEWNFDFEITAWNPAAERIFGYSAAEAIGRPGSALIARKDGKENPSPFPGLSSRDDVSLQSQDKRGSFFRQGINAFAVVNRTKKGETIICDWYNTPLVDTSGHVVGIASLVLDVTGRKQAEDALAEEKERLAVTLRSIDDGVIATDTEGRINLINMLAEELTGWSQSEAMWQPLSDVFNVVDEESRVSYRNPLSHVLSSGEIVDLPDSSVLIARNGTEKLIAASAAPIHDRESKIIGSVVVFRDITGEHQLMQERLRSSKLDSLSILAGGIAHDFNNILTAVIGNLSFARMFTKSGERQYERLEEAEKAALRAKDLATQLLTFSKGGAPIRQTASLKEIIEDSAAFALRGSNVRCEFDMVDNLVTVEVDPGQISQVVNNLVINAVQSMPEGGVIRLVAENYRIETDSAVPLPLGVYARIVVQDRGHGIHSDHLPHVFDPYFTTKEKGSGLGLATSYSIIKHHDGLITVDSTPDQGTKFTIYLPASDKLPPEDEAAESAPIEGQGRVLVMDDEEIIRELAVASLDHLGYRVDAVENGQACIEYYQKARDAGDPYDVVIMDLTIPGGMGGLEAIGRLKEIDPEITAIVSSGYSSGPVLANYETHGFKGVVAKPYKVEDLARTLAELIRKNRS